MPEGSQMSPNGSQMGAKWGSKRSKNETLLKNCRNQQKHTIYYTSATSATPKNHNFGSFCGSKNDVETERRPNGTKMPPTCPPKASRTGPEPKIGRNRVPNGLPRASQSEPKNRILGVLGHRCDAKGLQGVSGHPPRLKMEPKWHRNPSKMGQTSKA